MELISSMMVGGIIGALGIAGIFIYVWATNRPHYRAFVLEERANGELVILLPDAKIRIIRKKGEMEKWKLQGTTIPLFTPIDKSHVLSGKKLDWLILLRDKDGFFHPMDPATDERMRRLILKPNYRDQIDWLIQETEERAKLKEKGNKLEKFLPTIALVICAMIFFLTIFFSYQYAEKKVGQIESTATSVQNRVDEWKADVNAFGRVAQQVSTNQRAVATENWTNTNVPIVT